MSWAKRPDSESAFHEIWVTLMRDEIAHVQPPMIAEAMSMIVNEHAPVDPDERWAYLLEVTQLLAVGLAIVASVSTPPDWLQE